MAHVGNDHSLSDEQRAALNRENKALERERTGASTPSGQKAVSADSATTAGAYALALRPRLSIDTLAKRTNIDKTTLQGVLNGFPPKYLSATQAAAFKKATGLAVKEATRALTPDVKAAVLHGLPMPKEREHGQ